MNIFADVFLAPTYQACTPNPKVNQKIVPGAPCWCAVQLWCSASSSLFHATPPCKLPYKEWIHQLYGAVSLGFHSQDSLLVPWALLIFSDLQHCSNFPQCFRTKHFFQSSHLLITSWKHLDKKVFSWLSIFHHKVLMNMVVIIYVKR